MALEGIRGPSSHPPRIRRGGPKSTGSSPSCRPSYPPGRRASPPSLSLNSPAVTIQRVVQHVRNHNAPIASFKPALTAARQHNQPPAGRPVNSGPRPCLIDDGFPRSGPQFRTSTSDLKRHARHTRYAVALRAGSATTAAHPPATSSPALPGPIRPPWPLPSSATVSTTNSHSWWTVERGPVSVGGPLPRDIG
jgi:hypothetical protein